MGDKFETKTAPLIKKLDTSEPHALTPKEQYRLACWAYKTTLMLECTGGGTPSVEPHEFERFRRAGEPPPNCSIVMGVSLYPVLAYHRMLMRQGNPPEPLAGYLALVVVSHVFFHIIGDAHMVNAHDVLAPAAIGVHFHRIWPRTGKMLQWPFDHGLMKQALVDLANWAGGSFEFVV